MKKMFFFLLLFPALAHAQTSRNGWSAGIGIGYFHYHTSWYYYRYDGLPRHDNYPLHNTNRTTVILNLEKLSLFRAGNIRFDLGGELLLGVAGKAKEDWLPDKEVISGGGLSAGINPFLKAVYPLPVEHSVRISPFVGLGPQFTMLHNNGKDVGGQFAANQYYHYTDGWNEYVLLLNATAGVGFELARFTVTPEVRLGIAGYSFTDWSPSEGGTSMEAMPGFVGLSVRVSWRL